MPVHAHRHLHIAIARRLAVAAVGCVAIAISSPAPPVAIADMATRVGGSFSISPARRTVVARPPVELSSTTVANTTEAPLRVRVYPVLLAQAPSGAFTFDPSPAELARARRTLEAAPSSFALAPQAVRQVMLRWRSLPHGAHMAAAGVVYQATPAPDGAPVQTVERLLGVDVLSLPGAHRSSGALTGLHVAQRAPGVLQFTAGVHNTGQAVAAPRRLELSIRDRGGAVRVHRGIATDIVLPGATRDFTVELARRLPAGRYTADALMDYGSDRRRSATLPFTLAAPNALTAPHLQVGPIAARGMVGAGAQITATLANTGTAAAHPVIELRLFRVAAGAQQRSAVAHRRVAPGALAPGAHRRLQISLGRLGRGTYVLSASYDDANGTPQTLVADFQAQPPVPPFMRVRQWLQQHPLLAPLLISGLGLGLVGALLARIRRLERGMRTS
jgi:hypothetical protein